MTTTYKTSTKHDISCLIWLEKFAALRPIKINYALATIARYNKALKLGKIYSMSSIDPAELIKVINSDWHEIMFVL